MGSEQSCTQCGETGHSNSRCYDLIGYPEWWDPTKAPRGRGPKMHRHFTPAVVDTKTDEVVIVAQQTSALVATTSQSGKILNMSAYVMNNAWIIDSRATDLMTFDSRHVSSLQPSIQKICLHCQWFLSHSCWTGIYVSY